MHLVVGLRFLPEIRHSSGGGKAFGEAVLKLLWGELISKLHNGGTTGQEVVLRVSFSSTHTVVDKLSFHPLVQPQAKS